MTEMDREAELLARISQLEMRLGELETRAEEADGRAAEWEARARARHDGDSMDSLVRDFLPAEVRAHLRAARREQLLAARAMVDHWIDRIDRKPAERRRRETIPVEEA